MSNRMPFTVKNILLAAYDYFVEQDHKNAVMRAIRQLPYLTEYLTCVHVFSNGASDFNVTAESDDIQEVSIWYNITNRTKAEGEVYEGTTYYVKASVSLYGIRNVNERIKEVGWNVLRKYVSYLKVEDVHLFSSPYNQNKFLPGNVLRKAMATLDAVNDKDCLNILDYASRFADVKYKRYNEESGFPVCSYLYNGSIYNVRIYYHEDRKYIGKQDYPRTYDSKVTPNVIVECDKDGYNLLNVTLNKNTGFNEYEEYSSGRSFRAGRTDHAYSNKLVLKPGNIVQDGDFV